jgi:hypothetical protein
LAGAVIDFAVSVLAVSKRRDAAQALEPLDAAVLIERRSREKAAECCLANDERIAAQIIAVEFDQVEGVEENAIIVVPVTDAVERRYSILAARDRLSVDDAGARAQLGDRLDDERESVGQVIAGLAPVRSRRSAMN